MNKLMFALYGATKYMAEAEVGGGGDGDPKDPPADPKDSPADPKDPPADPKDPPKDPPADPKDPPADPKDPPKDPPAEPKSAIEQKLGGERPKEQVQEQPPAELKDEDYLKAFVADEETKKLAAAMGQKDFELSGEASKTMMPVFREVGLSPEQAAKLANAYTRHQLADLDSRRKQRSEGIAKMNEEAFKVFANESDWRAIGRARDRFFREGGTMRAVLAHSELGSDIEFLSLMKFVGEKLGTDTTPSAGGAGAGRPKVSMAKALGIE